MNLSKYTLDRFEGGYAVFLKRPNETDQLLIHQSEIPLQLKEGDLVQITDNGQQYEFEFLKEETEEVKANVQTLLDDLKKRSH